MQDKHIKVRRQLVKSSFRLVYPLRYLTVHPYHCWHGQVPITVPSREVVTVLHN